MLNPFPVLLAFAGFAPLFLRVVIGAILIFLGRRTAFTHRSAYQKFFKTKEYPYASTLPWMLGIVEILLGAFIFVGFYTQVSVLIAIYIFINLFYLRREAGTIIFFSQTTFILLITMCLSLLFSGAGFYAFDIPL